MNIVSYVSQDADLTTGYVYQWTNQINGKKYIGSHCGNKPWYKTGGVALKAAFQKYGEENFNREILYAGTRFREVEEEILTSIQAAESLNFYNLINGAQGWLPGVAHEVTPELRAKLSEAGKKKIFSSSHRANLAKSSATKGKPSSNAHIRWHTNRGLSSPTCRWCQELAVTMVSEVDSVESVLHSSLED